MTLCIRKRLASLGKAAALGTAIALTAFSSHAQDVLLGSSLPRMLEYARKNNPEFAAMRLEADAAGQRVTPAGAFPDPIGRVEMQNLTAANDMPRSNKWTIAQSLPFFGKRDLRREVAEADAVVAGAKADAAWLEIATKIKTAYAQYYVAARSEALTSEIILILERLQEIALVRYAGGLVPQQDAIRAQVERTTMQSDLITYRSEKRQLRARLNALLSRPTDAPLAEPSELRPMPGNSSLATTALLDRIVARNPVLAADVARIQSAESSRSLTYRNRYPDLLVGVSPITSQGKINEWEVMLEINIPLQQESRRSQEAEAERMVDAARARRVATLNQLQQELAENLAMLEAAREMSSLTGSALLPQSELTLQSALVGYEQGKLDFATLLDAQRQIRKARQDRFKAEGEAQVRLAEIERLVGEEL